jgi:hypothetical protein
MKISVDRLCRLAGVSYDESRTLNEAGNRSYHEDPGLDAERKIQFANQLNENESELKFVDDLDEGMGMHEEDHSEGSMYEEDHTEGSMYEAEEDLDEVVEIDEVMLVQELRRAKNIMAESRNRRQKRAARNIRRKQRLQEAQLKAIIEDEVENVMNELNLTGDWMYGKNKPTRSRKGFVHQGSFLKGIGFK